LEGLASSSEDEEYLNNLRDRKGSADECPVQNTRQLRKVEAECRKYKRLLQLEEQRFQRRRKTIERLEQYFRIYASDDFKAVDTAEIVESQSVLVNPNRNTIPESPNTPKIPRSVTSVRKVRLPN